MEHIKSSDIIYKIDKQMNNQQNDMCFFLHISTASKIERTPEHDGRVGSLNFQRSSVHIIKRGFCFRLLQN